MFYTTPDMPPATSFFRPPAWSRANKSQTPEKISKQQTHDPPEAVSSPLSDPPPSTWIDLTSDAEDDPDPDAQLNTTLSQSVAENVSTSPVPAPVPASSPQPPPAPAPEQSFQSISSAPLLTSFGSSTTSQRIVKDGKEVVISSDGEDTDSLASLEDPDVLFAPKSKKDKKDEPVTTNKTTGTDKALLAQLSKPKKYNNTIDSLVNDAVDHDKIEENVAKVKAAFAQAQSNEQATPGHEGAKEKGLREDMLTSALGDNEEGIGFRRLLDAVRRTEALDQDRVWHFLDQTQMTPTTPEFPKDLFAPGSNMAMLRG